MERTLSSPTLVQRFARWLLAAVGWSVEIRWPPVPRAVIIVYPHTSNWDFCVGMLARFAAGLPVNWVGKDTIFRWPFGALWRRLGGIPVDRRESHGLVGQLEAELGRRERIWLAIAPEGTRKYTDHWKSGFWHLACAARVPVGLSYIDYAKRVVGLTEYVTMSGNAEDDLRRLRAYYAEKAALYPGQASEIRFR